MLPISGKPGPYDCASSSKSNPDFEEANRSGADKIKKANTLSLLRIFREFNVQVDEITKKARCPFHRGGNERTPSFVYYPKDNKFHCFGCEAHGRPCDFVAKAKSLSLENAADFIIDCFDIDVGDEVESSKYSFNDPLYFEFSELIREYIFRNPNRDEALVVAEKFTKAFDDINGRHQLDQAALRLLIDKIRIKIND